MLELQSIKKSYVVNNNKYVVLNDISIAFRKSEFVSILGPSGSGKTTLLNIIGGLDIYDEGNLIISGKSTNNFNDSDWDNYRNNKVGFIFQNYNLIDHLSVLENVKISLSLTGLSKDEVNKRSIDALNNVGLSDHIYKKPNQLSGGQMQRVSIARALVTNPDIIVADEPTGALDSKTSIEIIELLKKISKNKLVIMVTHNSILADKYSSRIIKINDGKIIDDSNPYIDNNKNSVGEIKKNKKMSFKSSIMLSLFNLITKKKRTILSSLACSIGIVGIALVLSLSNGVNKYIRNVESTSINDYPIIIERKTYNAFGIVNSNIKKCKKNNICITDDKSSLIIKNNIKDFKKYIEIDNSFSKYVSKIKYYYDIKLNVYSKKYKKINSEYFKELNNIDYSVIYGRLPEKYNEIVIVVDNNDYISKELLSINQDNIKSNYTYNEVIDNDLKLVFNTDYYKKEDNHYINYSNDYEYVKNLVDNGLELKVVGIVKNNDSGDSFIGYTDELNKHLIDYISKTDIYNEQVNNKSLNILNNTLFNDYDNKYEDLERELGLYEINNPSRISIYAKDYKSKEKIINIINSYNKKQTDKDKIRYQDLMKTLVDSLTSMINIISYVLIAFASISLIVSSIMISIITYISVLERTKEIGILRAIGASKKDIKMIFNTETIICGLISGLIGIFITLIISFILNNIIYSVFGINNISLLYFSNMILLIILSIFVNFISGLKSSIIASKKSIVDTLRCE